MGVRVEKSDLPGLGVRHDLVTARGRRIGVITFRDGRRELAIFDLDDPDSCRVSIPISDPEASTLAELLGASVVLSKLSELTDEAAGLFTEHLLIPNDSVYAGRPLGDTKARTRTGVSIVAIVRDKKVMPSPTPDFPLSAGDALIAVGTRKGLDSLADLIASSTG
ncbi:TrkA domain protein [Cryobacterium mesophilum]|uniref:Potassium transporter TrkA n=1 Tax=Terrimesophilobacter mesophilus TaxID=433647 RepID=A0A4R8VA25_9MICO|nr:cation:proton antiporter regulatory subunit [Terrimesophilobacter mesophilus]MBB5632805.1 TrkA domain protein [Terrimesophilobacter mesophilus]TFB79593.1 potassium transporter TrkA [Terrimesophilobacter mesophilus]